MVDCSLCKHHYLKHTDKYSVISDCKKGHFRIVSAYEVEPPKECSDFEPKGLTDEEKEIMKNLHTCPSEGLKYDEGKNRMGLMCENFSRALWEVAKVSTFGANKYGENSWQNLENAKSRYLDALCRHLFKHLQGEKVDDESGLLHLSHLAWNSLCLLEFELKDTMEFGTEKGLQQACDMFKKFLQETESEE